MSNKGESHTATGPKNETRAGRSVLLDTDLDSREWVRLARHVGDNGVDSGNMTRARLEFLNRRVVPESDLKGDAKTTIVPDERSVVETKGVQESENRGSGEHSSSSARSMRVLLGLSMRGVLGNGRGSGKGKMSSLRTRLTLGGTLQTNSVAAKFLVQIIGQTTFDVNQVVNSLEWSSVNVLFEEFFVHSMTLRYEPINQFTTGANTGTGNLEDSAIGFGAYQHNQPSAADTSHTWVDLQNSRQSALKNTGRPFTFAWKNVEKFTKDGPGGDATTATNSQSWLNINSVAKYGGFITSAVPFATAAAGTTVLFTQGYTFGTILVIWDVSFRYRD